jgi:hypothetical protein
MARTAQLVKGSDTVNLINTDSTGIIASVGGFGRTRVNPNLTFVTSSLANSASLRLKNYPPIIETWRLNLKDTSQDDAATQLQTLWRILLDADKFQLTNWQQSPVYLQEQFTNETNPRYSLVIAWANFETGDMFDQPFENDNDLDSFQIIIMREPFYRGDIPGILPDPLTMRTPGWEYFNSETIGSGGAINITGAAAQSGLWGMAVTVAGAGSESYGTIDPAIVGTANFTEFSVKLEINTDDLTMANGDEFIFLQANGSGTGGIAFQVEVQFSLPVTAVRLITYDDAGAATDATSFYNLASGKNIVLIEWKASTGPGNDDGEGILSIGGVAQETLSGIDNDTHDVDTYDNGPRSGLDAGTTGTLYIDNIQHDTASPFVAAERTTNFESTIGYVANHRHDNVLSHIFVEDNSATSFSSNLIDSTNYRYFPNPSDINDAIYFGGDNPFFPVALNIGTAGISSGSTVGSSIAFEYSDSSSTWATTGEKSPRGADNYFWNGETAGFTGHTEIANPGFSDWTKQTVNGQSKYWLRVRMTESAGTTPTVPRQGDQVVFTPNDTYIEINSNEINGDQPALSLLRLLDWQTITNSEIDWIAIGAKGRGLTQFTSRLNPGGQNPSGWAITFGTDSSSQSDTTAPAGATGRCTFATDQSLVARITFTNSTSGITADYEGRYNVFARAKQTSGSAGDVSVQLATTRGVTFLGPTVKTKQADQGFEIMFLGEVNILAEGIQNTEDGDLTGVPLIFALNMSATSDTPTLDVYDLVFIPIDEASMVASWSNRGNQALDGADVLNIDAGILRQNTTQLSTRLTETTNDVISPTPLSIWQTRGKLLELEPTREMRLYFLFGSTNSSTGIIESNQGMTLLVQLFTHEQWNIIRGAD